MEKFRSYFFFCFSAWNFLIYEFEKQKQTKQQKTNAWFNCATIQTWGEKAYVFKACMECASQ